MRPGSELRNVAIIGSSGGGTATLGHTDAKDLLLTIHEQLALCEGRIVAACFVSLDQGQGMDGVNDRVDTARLHTVKSTAESQPSEEVGGAGLPLDMHVSDRAVLREINQLVRHHDESIAHDIRNGRIHGLICISCHTLLFRETLTAAAFTGIAVTGSGGASLPQAVTLYGITLTGNVGGSVASTTISRAISFTYSLASHWKRSYNPFHSSNDTLVGGTGNTDIRWISVLNACLPAFWGVCLGKFVLKNALPSLEMEHRTMVRHVVSALENWVLPTSCAVIMATLNDSNRTPQKMIPTSSLLMASVIASSACQQSILSGLLAGWLVRQTTSRLFFGCIVANLPSTMTNLVSTGITACLVTALLLPISPILRRLTVLVRWTIQWTIVDVPTLLVSSTDAAWFARSVMGSIWGCLCCYGSKVGWYHTYFLPAILIEMELGDASFLGAIDVLALVLVCAGISAGIGTALWVCSLGQCECRIASASDASLCQRGLYVNVACGDFVEVCYPFMERHWLINASGYVAAGLSTGILVAYATTAELVPKSLAYLPLPVSILLTERQGRQMVVASVVAAGVSFIATFTACLATVGKLKQT